MNAGERMARFLNAKSTESEKRVKTVAVVDLQFGDTGKGKIVDLLASEWADIVVRGTGGPNAGHTVVHTDEKHVFHLIPTGILHDHRGTLNVLGNGVAFDPRVMQTELEQLRSMRLTFNGLRIAYNAKLLLPHHILIDRLQGRNSARGIGTTGRGVGPCYTDFVDRVGMQVNDILNPSCFLEKIQGVLDARQYVLRQFDIAAVRQMLETLGCGDVFDTKKILNAGAIRDRYCAYAEHFGEHIIDTDDLVRRNLGCKNIVLEGAQGVLLSIDHGTYPNVTSSDCSIEGLARGSGIPVKEVDYVLGVVKAFYMTRVGSGPFPTELGYAESSEKYPDASINSNDVVEQGAAMRRFGSEYGATTGRPRRTGWLDLPLLRHALAYADSQNLGFVLTKVDVLDDCESIKMCLVHRYDGDEYRLGNHIFFCGQLLPTAVMDDHILRHSTPQYETYPGWCCDITAAKWKSDLPDSLRLLIDEIEYRTSVPVHVLSVGPDREQTIIY